MAQTPFIPSPEHSSAEERYRIANRLGLVEYAADFITQALRVPASREVQNYAAQVVAKQPAVEEVPRPAATSDFEQAAQRAVSDAYQ